MESKSTKEKIINDAKKNNSNSKGVSITEEIRQTNVDGWLFDRPSNSEDIVSSKLEAISLNVEPDSEVYDMGHEKRGVALIFNHVRFKNMATRTGTVKDCNDLKETLTTLGFEVRIYNDPNTKTIFGVLQSTAMEDHTSADCLLVAVMSHGESGFIHSNDELYPVDTLWDSFTSDRCKSLVGKPKIFLIQACRGERLDKGVNVVHEIDSTPTYTIPAYADIMVAFSTYDGFYSWRNPEAGSWFIQAICKELNLNGHTRDLLTLMTFVNRRVAIEYQSYVPGNDKMNGKKQIPSIVTMLTRLVYFTRKNIETERNQSFEEIDWRLRYQRKEPKTFHSLIND